MIPEHVRFKTARYYQLSETAEFEFDRRQDATFLNLWVHNGKSWECIELGWFLDWELDSAVLRGAISKDRLIQILESGEK